MEENQENSGTTEEAANTSESNTEVNADNQSNEPLGITVKGIILTVMVVLFVVLLYNVWVKPLMAPADHSPSSLLVPENNVGDL